MTWDENYVVPGEDVLNDMALDELEQELARLRRWQEDLRASGQPDKAAELEAHIEDVEGMIADFEEE